MRCTALHCMSSASRQHSTTAAVMYSRAVSTFSSRQQSACHAQSTTFIALHQSSACCNAHLCPHLTMHQHCPAKLAQPSHLGFKLHAISNFQSCMLHVAHTCIKHHNCLAAYAAFAGLDQFSHLSLAITIMPSAVQRSAVQCRYKCSAVQCAALHCTVCQAQAGSTARQLLLCIAGLSPLSAADSKVHVMHRAAPS